MTNSVDFVSYTLQIGAFGPFGIGKFVDAVTQFLLVGFALFLLVKGINRLRRLQESKPAPTEDVTVSELSQQYVEQNREMIALLRILADRK